MKCRETCGDDFVRTWHTTRPWRWRWTLRRVLYALLVAGWVGYLSSFAWGATGLPPAYAVVYVDGSVGLYSCQLDMLECLTACDEPVLWSGQVSADHIAMFPGLRPRLCSHVMSMGAES